MCLDRVGNNVVLINLLFVCVITHRVIAITDQIYRCYSIKEKQDETPIGRVRYAGNGPFKL